MGLESVTFVSDLNTSNPVSNDLRSQGDDHLRAIKLALRNTFPNAIRAYRFPTGDTANVDTTFSSQHDNLTVAVDTSAGSRTMTLPALTSANSGFAMTFVKSVAANSVVIVPASGTINGAASVTLTAQYDFLTAVWTGSTWWALHGAGAVTAAQISDASADGRSILTAADYAAMRTLLSLVVGTHVQAWNTHLDSLVSMSKADNTFVVANGTTFNGETPASARNSLGLGDFATMNIADFVHTGVNNATTDFPVGHTVLVEGGGINRNDNATVRLDGGDTESYTLTGAASALSGTWRARGRYTISGDTWTLFQRMA